MVGWQSRPVWLGLQDVAHHLHGALSADRGPAGEHLVDDRAESPDVGAPIGALPLHLLGTHVQRRPKHHALLSSIGWRAVPVRRRPSSPRRRDGQSQAEIEHLDDAVGTDLDVGRFQVAVHDIVVVRSLEGLGDLPRQGERLTERQPGDLRSRCSSVSPSTTSRTSACTPSARSTP